MDRLSQSNSAEQTTTVSSRETPNPYRSPYSEEPESSRFPTVAPLNTKGYSSDTVTGATWAAHQQPPIPQHADMESDNETVLPCRNRRAEYSQTSDVTDHYEKIIDAITTLPNRLRATNTNQKLLHTQVPTFRRKKDRLNKFEHLLRNHLRQISNRFKEEVKLQFFQSLLREETIEFSSH